MSRAAWIVNEFVMSQPELEGLIDPEDIYPVSEPTTGHGIPFILYDVDNDVTLDLYALQRDRIRYFIYCNDLVDATEISEVFKYYLGREGESYVPSTGTIMFDYFRYRGSTMMPPLEEGGPYTVILEFEYGFRDSTFV